jgi:hypothetical protein
MRRRIKNLLLRILRPLFDEIYYRESRDIARWRRFNAVAESGQFVEAHLPLAPAVESRYELYDLLIDRYRLNDREGLVCEFGVAGGKSLNYLARRLPGHTLYGFDSFEGLPEDWRQDLPRGTFKQKQLPEVSSNVELVQGWFDDSLAPFLAEHSGDALLLHIDCDLYSSTMTVLRAFRPRIKLGTILVFDEFFNYPGWQAGEAKAFLEFIDESGLAFEYLSYNMFGTQLAVRSTEDPAARAPAP